MAKKNVSPAVTEVEVNLPVLSPAMDPAHTEDLSGLVEPVTETPAPRAPMMADVVQITVRGKMTDCYIITEPMGTSKKGPLERWFEKARCKSFTQNKDRTITLTLTREYLHKRGITHEDLPVTLAVEPTAPAAPAPAEEVAA